MYAAAFSPRPGTPASRLPDDVPADEKRRRLNVLLAVQEEIGFERNRSWEGRTTRVLLEEIRPPRSHEHHDGEGLEGPDDAARNRRPEPAPGTVRLAGRNRENKLVHLDGRADLLGREVDVRIDRAGPYALVGSLLGPAGS